MVNVLFYRVGVFFIFINFYVFVVVGVSENFYSVFEVEF